jgi:hypothetical protein
VFSDIKSNKVSFKDFIKLEEEIETNEQTDCGNDYLSPHYKSSFRDCLTDGSKIIGSLGSNNLGNIDNPSPFNDAQFWGETDYDCRIDERMKTVKNTALDIYYKNNNIHKLSLQNRIWVENNKDKVSNLTIIDEFLTSR